jgi:hypothetical protein
MALKAADEMRWQREYRQHREKLNRIRSSVDNAKPAARPHLRVNRKKEYMLEGT